MIDCGRIGRRITLERKVKHVCVFFLRKKKIYTGGHFFNDI